MSIVWTKNITELKKLLKTCPSLSNGAILKIYILIEYNTSTQLSKKSNLPKYYNENNSINIIKKKNRRYYLHIGKTQLTFFPK